MYIPHERVRICVQVDNIGSSLGAWTMDSLGKRQEAQHRNIDVPYFDSSALEA